MKLRLLAFLVIPLWLWPVSLLADFQAGMDAYDQNDYATAYREWLPLAEQGNAGAQFNLGWMYYQGKGVPEDRPEAAKWYRLAAEQGNAGAQFNVGRMYDNGEGVPLDYAEAVKRFRLAAKQGNAAAQVNLGGMYYDGWDVPQDYVTAYAWFNLAAAQGHERGVKNRDMVQESMTPAQIAEGQKLSRELFERLKK
jgi:TPR repeat protein